MRNKPTPVPSLASATLPSSSKHVSRHIDLRGPAAPARFEPINLEEEPAPDPPLPPPPPVSDATSPSTPAFLSKLRSLITALPSSVPIATADGPLASFAADPASFDDPSLASEDLWEEVLNTTMKAGLGWGTELNAGGLIQRGEWGMDGLLRFVEYFVTTRGVPVGLFEGKLDRAKTVRARIHLPPMRESQSRFQPCRCRRRERDVRWLRRRKKQRTAWIPTSKSYRHSHRLEKARTACTPSGFTASKSCRGTAPSSGTGCSSHLTNARNERWWLVSRANRAHR